MAAVSLSPAPPQHSAMSTRRIPLSTSNPNVANSPMRAASAGLYGAKKVRPHAEQMREDAYAQPPPAKRQMIDRGVASPTRTRTTRTIVHRTASRATGTTSTATHSKTSHASTYKPTEEEMVNLRTWHTQIRSRFPKMVFYFESISDEQRSKLAKQVGRLGAVSDFDVVAVCRVKAHPPPSAARREVLLDQHYPHRHDPADPSRETERRPRGRHRCSRGW